MASRDQEKLPANLLRESLLVRKAGLSAEPHLSDSADSCPDPEILAAYFDRSLDTNETAHFELHLSQCATCRAQLAAMHRADESAAAHAAQAARSSSWVRLLNWRWLAPVAAVLIVAGVWVAHRSPLRPKEQHAFVAMSQSQPAPTLATPARNDPRGESGNPSAVAEEKAKEQAYREFSAADNLTLENPQTHPLQKHGNAKDQDSERTANRPAGPGDSKKQSEAPSPVSSQAADNANGNGAAVAGALEPSQSVATAGATAQSITVEGDANSIGPQSGAAETQPRQAAASARVSPERMRPEIEVHSSGLALQAVERRSGVRIINTPDPKLLWRIGTGGLVERSADGGANWKSELPSADAQLTAGFAPSADICWMVGRDGAIFVTSNASDWKRIQPPIAADFKAVVAQDASSATVTTVDGRKFTTADGGAHWGPAQ